MRRAPLVLAATLFAALSFVAACGGDESGSKIVLLTHESFAVSPDVIAAFEADTGIDVEILRAGDAGAMVNQAILTKDNPTADVMFGVDTTFLSRALDNGLFDPYQSPLLNAVPASLQTDPDHRVTPIDYGDVCVNFDRVAFVEAGVAIPVTLRDLADPSYRGDLVVEDPATSSPGLAFLLSTIVEFGETGDYTWKDFWSGLVANDVLVTSGWEEAYYSEFSGGSGTGDRPLVVSYASSPPAEVLGADQPGLDAPTGVVPTGCFRQVEYAGILAGTESEQSARKLVDFLLSIPFQQDVPLSMFVFPANSEAALPPVFVDFAAVPATPNTMAPDTIEANRERWISEWIEIVR